MSSHAINDLAITVVVAVWPDASGLKECLAALANQRERVQVIAVHAPKVVPMTTEFPSVQWLAGTPGELIPHLWTRGMAAATGEVIAITTGHFAAAPDWISKIRNAYARHDTAAIGGLIDPPRGGSLTDWATYFLRYSSQFEFKQEQLVHDLAGDNATYRRTEIAQHWESLKNGFWEPEYHRRLLAERKTLWLVPEIRIMQRRSFGIRGFCRQRAEHGKHYGHDRMQGQSVGRRLAGVVLAPLIPLVLLTKVTLRLRHRPKLLPVYLASVPVLTLFIISWACGEFCGYLGASSAQSASPTQQSLST